MPSDYDLNRFKKTYPFVRRQPLMVTLEAIETAAIPFSNDTSVTHAFINDYLNVPIVTANASDDVNVFITAVTRTHVTVDTSGPFTGTVYVHIAEAD